MYLLKLAMRPWRQAPFEESVSLLALGSLLFTLAIMAWLYQATDPIIARIQNEQILTAYLSPDVRASDENTVVDRIKTTLGAAAVSPESLQNLEMVTVDGFLDKIKVDYPGLRQVIVNMGSELQNIVPRYVSISGFITEQAVERVREIEGVEFAESSHSKSARLVTSFQTLKWFSLLMAMGTFLAISVILFQKGRAYSRMQVDALAVLKLWGADGLLLRFPLMIACTLVAVGTTTVATVFWVFFNIYAVSALEYLSPLFRFMPAPGAAPLLLGILLLAGLALLISMSSVRSVSNVSEGQAG